MIEKEGFEGQEHNVTTRDGFILTLHRVTKSSNEIVPTKRPAAVVFIQHGLLCSAAEWVIGSRENSLAFLLANEGYDVWLGNFRGNIYSRSHKTLNATDAQFWDFSWDEMAKYDLPSMLNYTLNVTRQNSLIYVGHSMGTTALFAMSTLYPKYAHKVVKAAVLLAPVAAIPNMSSPLRFLFSPVCNYQIVQLSCAWENCCFFTVEPDHEEPRPEPGPASEELSSPFVIVHLQTWR